MKKHLCGFFIALTTFLLSFYVSPIRFTDNGSGHGATSGFLYQCSFSNHNSNHFSAVSRWRCSYENPETVIEMFENDVSDATEIVEPVEEIKLESGKIIRRAIIKNNQEDLQVYWLLRTDEEYFDTVSSTSLRHVKEFEEQRLKY